MWGEGGEELLARLKAQDGVAELQRPRPDWDRQLRGRLGHAGREGQVLHAAGEGPGGEPSPLAVVAVVGHRHLGADHKDGAVQEHHAAVVQHPQVHNGHPDVHDHPRRVGQQLQQHLPRVLHRVQLQEVVLAPVPWDFQLGAHPVRRPRLPRAADGLDDPLQEGRGQGPLGGQGFRGDSGHSRSLSAIQGPLRITPIPSKNQRASFARSVPGRTRVRPVSAGPGGGAHSLQVAACTSSTPYRLARRRSPEIGAPRAPSAPVA